jgi:hypothetical protein
LGSLDANALVKTAVPAAISNTQATDLEDSRLGTSAA